MAAPAWSDLVQSQSASLVTPIVVTMPTNLATGDRVVIFITMGRNRTQGLNWNTGTTGFVSALGGTTFNTAGNDHEHDVGYGDFSGSPPATISITPSQSKAFIAWAGRIPAGTFDPATAPEFTTTPDVADPANLDPSWTEDTLFIAGISADELTFITFPLPDDQDSDEISNVSGAVCSIGQTGGAARNVAAWAVTEANLKGVATVCIRASAAGTPATVTPAAIACTTSLPSSSRNIAAGPAAITMAVAFPQSSAGQSISVQPAAVAASVALPAATVGVSAGSAVTANVVALPAAATSAGATVQPAVIGVTVSIPQAGSTVGVGPAVTAVVVALPQAAAGAATVVTATPVAATVALPAVGVTLTATATPAAISCPVALPQAAPVTEGGAVVAPATVACTISAPLALPAAQTVVSPAVAAVLAALPTLAVLAAATAIPGVVAAQASVPQAAASTGDQPPDPVAASFTESFGATYREPPPRAFRESA